jgi:DNA mismatch repair protein MutL
MGWELDEALLEFEATESARTVPMTGADVWDSSASDGPPERPAHARVGIWGLAGLPAIARATSKFQYLGVKEAYRGLIPHDQYPVAAVFLEVDPHTVDVNIHPAKLEVRFQDSNRMHGLVLTAIRQRLLASDLTPSVSASVVRPAMGTSEARVGTGAAASVFDFAGPPRGKLTTEAFVDYFRQMDPKEKGFAYEQVKQAFVADSSGEGLSDPAGGPGYPAGTLSSTSMAPSVLRQGEVVARPLSSPSILQVHNSYLVTQDEQGLIIIDQHALHERVIFEELRKRVLGKNLESQRLLTPVVVRANPQRMALLESLRCLLERIGVEADPIGPDAVAVHAFPSFLFDRRVDPVGFMNSLLDLAQEGKLQPAPNDAAGGLEEAVLHKVIDIMACKAAVKAGDQLSVEELQSLLTMREQVERSSNCPHGRPTTVRFTLEEMAKHFKRT